jgi:Spy/CpxP family protein refolding chaperone
MLRVRRIALFMAAVGWMTMDAPGRAAEPAKPVPNQDRLERFAAKLQLDDKQREEIRRIAAAFDVKTSPVEYQRSALHREELQAVKKLLTPAQQALMPQILKALADQQFETAVAPLNLTDEQSAAITKIRAAYAPKFHEVAVAKDNGENQQQRFGELRQQMLKAIRAELTDAQRDKLPLVLGEQQRFWHDPASRRELFTALGETLGVNAEQKDQVRRLQEQYDPRVRAVNVELRKLHQEEHAAIGAVLTDEQRAQWKELHRGQQR